MTALHSACLAISLLVFACGGGDSDSGKTPDGAELDPCSILTQADASALFGEPAITNPDTSFITDPAFIGECSWTWEPPDELGSQTVTLFLWDGAEYYSMTPGDMAFDIGDEGSVAASDGAGIDVSWHQGGVTAVLSYFTVGSGVPDHLTKLEEVKALALEASARF